jgi:hypothetical protein
LIETPMRGVVTRQDNSTPSSSDDDDGYSPTLGDIRHFYPGVHSERFLPPTRAELDEYVAAIAKIDRQARRERERRERERTALDITEVEKRTGKPVASVTTKPDGSRTFTFGEPLPSEAPSTGLTADDELERWRRKHAR